MNQKQKGNSFERKVAKDLSIWIFGDKDVLKRHPTSGFDKSIYSGDIIPLKQIHWDKFPFYIETKHGYKNQIPSFYNWEIINKWIKKAIEEMKNLKDQKILWLICKFQGHKTLFITSFPFNIEYIIPLKIYPLKDVLKKSDVFWIYIYEYDKVLSQEFENALKKLDNLEDNFKCYYLELNQQH